MDKITCLQDVLKLEKTRPVLANQTYEIFSESARKHADKIAVRFLLNCERQLPSEDYTYRNLYKGITQTANALHHLGLKKQEVVSFLLPNLPETLFAMWGAQTIGIANPINPLLEPEQIISIMNAAESKILIIAVSTADKSLLEKSQVIIDKVPTLTTILVVDIDKHIFKNKHAESYRSKIPMLDFHETIANQNAEALDFDHQIQSTDLACYLHTGGTTGMPKLAMLTHGNLIHAAWTVVVMPHYVSEDVFLACLPLFHVFSIVACGLAPFMAGAEILLASPKGFRDEQVILNLWRLIETYKVTCMLAVPTVYSVLSNIPIQHDISSLQYCVSGSSPLPIQSLKNFEKHTGVPVYEGYGMTESACIISVNIRFGERKIGAVGLRIPFQEIKIVSHESNSLLGKIFVRGPNVFKGYKGIQTNFTEDGWFDTGDLGFLDADGYLWIRGRSKDLIIRGGHNIDPQLIEEVLYQHPAVLAAAAIGKPCSRVGELPVAYVSLREKNAVTEAELIEFVASNISEQAAIPKNITIIQTMPVTAVGKIYKPALRQDATKKVLMTELAPISQDIPFELSVLSHKQYGQFASVSIQKEVSSQITDEFFAVFKKFNVYAEIEVLSRRYCMSHE